jgi:hypothetical protein
LIIPSVNLEFKLRFNQLNNVFKFISKYANLVTLPKVPNAGVELVKQHCNTFHILKHLRNSYQQKMQANSSNCHHIYILSIAMVPIHPKSYAIMMIAMVPMHPKSIAL